MIDNRIRVFEGKPQRYGTQLRHGPAGIEPHPIENESRVNSMRMQAGLPLPGRRWRRRAQPAPPASVIAAREAAELEFRRVAGWFVD